MFWDFQIVEIGSTNPKDSGVQKLVVVDANFTGMPTGGKLVNGTDSQEKLFTLQTIGVNSPLLEINMKLEVKGAIANQVMMQRGDLLTNGSDGITKSSAAIEDKVEDFSGLFSDGLTDNLTAKIIEIQNTIGPDAGGAPSSDEVPIETRNAAGIVIKIEYKGKEFLGEFRDTSPPGSDPTRPGAGVFREWISPQNQLAAFLADERAREAAATAQANWVMFMQKAAVFPRENDPTLTDFFGPTGFWNNIFDLEYNNTTLDQLIVGVWEDSQLLRQVYEYDMIDPTNLNDRRFEPRKNPGYLPIEVTFTLHGVSGFKVGDMIHFVDLPHVYREKIFTVMNVTQVIDGDMWKTTVTTACRNLPAPGSSPIGIPAPPLPTPNPLPGNTEGQGTPPPSPSPGQITETGNYWPPGQEPDWSR
jgi:hypothetical protein